MSSSTSNGLQAHDLNWFVFGGSLTEWFLLFVIVALLMYGVWWSTSPFLNRPPMITNSLHLSLLTLGITFWLLTARFNSFPSFTLFKSNLLYDDFSMKVSLVLVASTIVCLLMSREYLENEKILFSGAPGFKTSHWYCRSKKRFSKNQSQKERN